MRQPTSKALLTTFVDYIRRDNPTEAQRLAQEIYDRIGMLETFPRGGRPGRVEGTREMLLPPLPFIVVY